MPTNSEHYLGFMSLKVGSADGSYIGAVLVTDQSGFPQEFRCTHPVKPTAVQKSLYGASLEPHIGIELCGRPLFASLVRRPTILFLTRVTLLDLRPSLPIPTLVIGKAGEAFQVRTEGSPQRPMMQIESPTGRFSPVNIQAHPDYLGDRTVATQELQQIAFDPLEVFTRISTAIEQLVKQDQRFQ